ncbi:MAG: hypothetical protein AAF654_13360 [Myxococcota bacterium]
MLRWTVFVPCLLLLFSIQACSGDDDAEGCSVAGGTTGFGTTVPCIDIGDFFSGNATCLATGEFDTSACTGASVLGEYEFCESGGTSCTEGTECLVFLTDTTGTLGLCAESCDPNNDACGAERSCIRLTADGSVAGCFDQTGIRNTFCGIADPRFFTPSATSCVDGLACEPSVFGGECKDVCDTADLGTTTNCVGGDTCLTDGEFQIQTDADGIVECPTIGTTTGCADGFSCVEFGGLNQMAMNDPITFERVGFCARQDTVCGTTGPIVSDFTETGIADLERSAFCNLPQQDTWCPQELQAGATASVECAYTGFISSPTLNGAPIACQSSVDCPAGLDLVCLSGRCTNRLNTCVAFCEDQIGDNPLDCGAGFTCQAPTTEEGEFIDIIFQTDPSSGIVSCPNGDECAVDFTCEPDIRVALGGEAITLPPTCVRNRRVCVADP